MVSPATPRLLIGTRNNGKVREIEAALRHLPLELQRLEAYPNLSEPVESGSSYIENALIKARYYAGQTGLLALADDSGLEVESLNGAPGVTSARFGGALKPYSERIALLLSTMAQSQSTTRRARFVCVVIIASPDGDELYRSTGICEGQIASAPVGDKGFGFDPVFIPHGHDRTFAELPSEIKNTISHRAKALAATSEFLARNISRLASGESRASY